jgi:hypothetical protein
MSHIVVPVIGQRLLYHAAGICQMRCTRSRGSGNPDDTWKVVK